MSFTIHPARTSPAPVPTAVQWSVGGWLVAVTAGVAETLVHLALPDPPSAGALAVRAGIYAVVVVLVLALTTGRRAVRWAILSAGRHERNVAEGNVAEGECDEGASRLAGETPIGASPTVQFRRF